jgi:hypothetical protein
VRMTPAQIRKASAITNAREYGVHRSGKDMATSLIMGNDNNLSMLKPKVEVLWASMYIPYRAHLAPC